MSLFKTFGTDEKMELSGVPIQPAGANDDGTMPTFIVSRIGGQNHQFTKIREQVMRPYIRDVEAGTIDPHKLFRLNVEVFCKANLRGWSHVQDAENKLIPYSVDNAIKLLTALPDLYQELAYQASRVTNYQAVEKETATKN
jgi:hypothetical protein